MIWVVINAAFTVANVALYAVFGYWWNLAAAIFCALVCVLITVMETQR